MSRVCAQAMKKRIDGARLPFDYLKEMRSVENQEPGDAIE
jgi:hypothetical protein